MGLGFDNLPIPDCVRLSTVGNINNVFVPCFVLFSSLVHLSSTKKNLCYICLQNIILYTKKKKKKKKKFCFLTRHTVMTFACFVK